MVAVFRSVKHLAWEGVFQCLRTSERVPPYRRLVELGSGDH